MPTVSLYTILYFVVVTPSRNNIGQLDPDADITVCPKCHSLLNDPKTLPCMDSFCLKCLEEIRSYGEWIIGSFCPECLQHFVIPPTGLQSLPTCSFILKKVHLRKIESRDGINKLCEICVQMMDVAADVAEATAYCVTCQQKLCNRCWQCHRVIAATKRHNVVALGAGDTERLLSSPEDWTLQCSSHPEKPAQLHCSSCCLLLCNECLTLHTWHELETIADAKLRYRTELNECVDKLNKHLTRYVSCQRRIECVTANLNEIETAILQKAEQMKRQVDEHKKALLDKLESIRGRHNGSKQALDVSPWRRMLKTIEFINALASMGSDRDLMSFSKETIDSASQQLMTEMADMPIVNSYKFEARQNIAKRQVNIVGSIGMGI